MTRFSLRRGGAAALAGAGLLAAGLLATPNAQANGSAPAARPTAEEGQADVGRRRPVRQ